ncbi:MAG: hypothetical protein QF898_15430, partial [SAR202 cluster bacterium]|nr:hypothetical protein [SAR202 cluster bacterium]
KDRFLCAGPEHAGTLKRLGNWGTPTLRHAVFIGSPCGREVRADGGRFSKLDGYMQRSSGHYHANAMHDQAMSGALLALRAQWMNAGPDQAVADLGPGFRSYQ